MRATGAKHRTFRVWWHDHSAAQVCAAVGLLVLLLVGDLLGGADVRLGGAMLALPALAAVFATPTTVIAIVVFMLPAYTTNLAINNRFTWQEAPVQIATALLIATAAVGASLARQRRERQLAHSREVTALTQQIVLRPLPPRLGPLEVSSGYIASDEESTIGGDLYAGTLVDGRPRVIIGDVQGKGLSAVEMVMHLLIAFHDAARRDIPLAELPACLDETLRETLRYAFEAFGDSDDEHERRSQECFVTAAIVEASADGGEIYVANCGHPPPLLFRSGGTTPLTSSEPAPPLGLLPLGDKPVCVDIHKLAPGDTLLLYTDGLIEARSPSGQFYPLQQRSKDFSAAAPQTILEELTSDLRKHTRKRLEDDVAMMTLHRPASALVTPRAGTDSGRRGR